MASRALLLVLSVSVLVLATAPSFGYSEDFSVGEGSFPLPPGAQQLLPIGASSLTNFSFWKMDGSDTYASRVALSAENGIRVTKFGGPRAAPLTYRADIKGALPFAVHAGDTALIQFQARATPGAVQPPHGTLLTLAFQDNVQSAKYFKFLFTTMKLTSQWQNWSFPIKIQKKDVPAGLSVIQFEFGFPNSQSFDLNGVRVHLWPKKMNVTPDVLPSCCLPNATYPGRDANATVCTVPFGSVALATIALATDQYEVSRTRLRFDASVDPCRLALAGHGLL